MTTSIAGLPEASSATAARILAAANDLLIGHGVKGFTVADVATRAHTGKGTVYLYWPTKEDLLIGLIGRGFLSILDDLIEAFTDDADLARPSHFCSAMLRAALGQPLIAAMQRHDGDLLGILADHPRSVALDEALGPAAVLHAALPLWRANGMARTDWDIADQTFALQALVTGVTVSLVQDSSAADRHLTVLDAATTALLGPERANQKRLRATASGIIEFLQEGRTAALGLLAMPTQ